MLVASALRNPSLSMMYLSRLRISSRAAIRTRAFDLWTCDPSCSLVI